MLGEGPRLVHAAPTLNNERIMVASLCMGVLDGVLEDALAYVKERGAFGKTIGEFQILQHYIADISMWRRQAELLIYQAAWLLTAGKACFWSRTSPRPRPPSTRSGGRPRDPDLGGMGYSAETDTQRYWRDARLFRIGPVTNEMARNSIAEHLGLPALVLSAAQRTVKPMCSSRSARRK